MPNTQKRSRRPRKNARRNRSRLAGCAAPSADFLSALEHDRAAAAASLAEDAPPPHDTVQARTPHGFVRREDGRLFRLPPSGDVSTGNANTQAAQAAAAAKARRIGRLSRANNTTRRVFPLPNVLLAREQGYHTVAPLSSAGRPRSKAQTRLRSPIRVPVAVMACGLRRDPAGIVQSPGALWVVRDAPAKYLSISTGNLNEIVNAGSSVELEANRGRFRPSACLLAIRGRGSSPTAAADRIVMTDCSNFDSTCCCGAPSIATDGVLIGDRRGRAVLWFAGPPSEPDDSCGVPPELSKRPCNKCGWRRVYNRVPPRPVWATVESVAFPLGGPTGRHPPWLRAELLMPVTAEPHMRAACAIGGRRRSAAVSSGKNAAGVAGSILPGACAWLACPQVPRSGEQPTCCGCAGEALGAVGWLFWGGDMGEAAASWDLRCTARGPLAVFRGYQSGAGRWASTAAVSECGRLLVVCRPLRAGDASGAECSGVCVTMWDALRGGWPISRHTRRVPTTDAGDTGDLPDWSRADITLPLAVTCVKLADEDLQVV